MSRPAILLATLAFLAATAASAQESGGVQPGGRFFNPATGSVAQPGPGCRLSQTNVVVGVNRALATGARAGQRVNLEVDMLARYVARLLEHGKS